MFPAEPTKIVITGMQVPTRFGYKCENGTLVETGEVGVLKSDGTFAEPQYFGVITSTPRTFAFATAMLSSGTTHVKGTVVPVNSIIKVSTYTPPNDKWGEELDANCIAQTQSDADGLFSFDFVGVGKNVVVWCEIPSTFEAINCGIDISVTHEDDGGEYLIQTAYQCGSYNNQGLEGTPTFTMSGNCPTDATQVYISRAIEEQTDLDANIMALTDNTIYSAIPSDGAYSVSFADPIPVTNVVVWCISETANGTITASYSVDVGSIESVCLAGDTPILLYDGTYKALRDLTADDVLMAGDHTPTRITKIKRGIVSDYHTLYLFDDGTIIDEAHRHRFYNMDAGCWMYLDEWKIGDRAKNYDGSTPKLIRIERVDEPCRRYGLWTESHDYYAGNLLSGETAANQSVLANATLEQAADMMATLEADKLDKLYKGELG